MRAVCGCHWCVPLNDQRCLEPRASAKSTLTQSGAEGATSSVCSLAQDGCHVKLLLGLDFAVAVDGMRLMLSFCVLACICLLNCNTASNGQQDADQGLAPSQASHAPECNGSLAVIDNFDANLEQDNNFEWSATAWNNAQTQAGKTVVTWSGKSCM